MTIEVGNWSRNALRSAFSDKDGSVSNTRVMQFLVVTNALTCVSVLVFMVAKKTAITLADVGMFLTPLTVFVVTIITAVGAIKATTDVMNNRATNAPPNQGAPPSVVSPLEPAEVSQP